MNSWKFQSPRESGKQLTFSTVSGRSYVLQPAQLHDEGGEGEIYVVGDLVMKLYFSCPGDLPARVDDLHVFDAEPRICNPIDILLQPTGKLAGAVFPYIRDASPICRYFSASAYSDFQLSVDKVLDGFYALVSLLQKIHSKKHVVVDLNETNFLVKNHDLRDVYIIDTDSFATPHCPATALKPHVQDPMARSFSADSDFYSLAILGFQLLTGIHPFKGTHPNFSKKELLNRMKSGVSVLDPAVRVPASVRDWSTLPTSLLEWFHQLFSSSRRSAPPLGLRAQPLPLLQRVSSDALVLQLLFSTVERLRGVAFLDSTSPTVILLTGAGQSCQTVSGQKLYRTKSRTAEIYAVPVNTSSCTGFFVYERRQRKLAFVAAHSTQPPETAPFDCDTLLLLPDATFIRLSGTGAICALKLVVLSSGKIQWLLSAPWQFEASYFRSFSGIAIVNVLGVPTLVVPVGGSMPRLELIRMDVLRGHLILEMKRAGNVVLLSAQRSADTTYTRFRIILTADCKKLQELFVEDQLEAAPEVDVVLVKSVIAVEHFADHLLVYDTRCPETTKHVQVTLAANARLLSTSTEVFCQTPTELLRLRLQAA